MRRLVLAPHMDDESLGCGGLLAKSAVDTTVVTVADSGETRAAEHRRALEILGSPHAVALNFPDGNVGGEMSRLVAELDRVFAETMPDEVYLPFPSLHQDHIATYEAGMRACRISMSDDHWVPDSVYVYDIAVYDVNLYPSDLRWNVFQELTVQDIEKKQAACAAYASETPEGAHPMSSVRQLAAALGQVRRVDFAEQYALVRQVRR